VSAALCLRVGVQQHGAVGIQAASGAATACTRAWRIGPRYMPAGLAAAQTAPDPIDLLGGNSVRIVGGGGAL
jgi:hypothetical protein